MFVESTSQYFFGSSGAAPMELLTELDSFSLSVLQTCRSCRGKIPKPARITSSPPQRSRTVPLRAELKGLHPDRYYQHSAPPEL